MYFFILTCTFFSILFFQLPFFFRYVILNAWKRLFITQKAYEIAYWFSLWVPFWECACWSACSVITYSGTICRTLWSSPPRPACDCCRNPWTTVLMKCTGWSDIARQIPILPIILNITPIPALSCPYPLMIPSTRNAAGILLIIICPELPLSHRSIICRW